MSSDLPSYKYLLKDSANTDLLMDDIMSHNRSGYINIICYHVTTRFSNYPFIQIMLEKSPFMFGLNIEKLELPSITLASDNSVNFSTNVLNLVKSRLLELGCDPTVLDESAIIGLINNNKLLLVDISPVDIYRISITRQNNTWFALPTEIMNTQTICNIHIDQRVTNLFLQMPELSLLYNSQINSIVYPLPDAVYTGADFKKVEFCSVFGISKAQIYSSCGEYFYFFRIFEDAVREGGWKQSYLKLESESESETTKSIVDNDFGRYIRGGINRYALFPGNYATHIETTNRFSLTDDIINGLLGEKNTIVIQYENEELDTILPDLLVKEYEMFTPISYHMLNKSMLGEKYEVENQDKYMIL